MTEENKQPSLPLTLFKQMLDDLDFNQLKQRAASGDEMASAEVAARQQGLIEAAGVPDKDADCKRIAGHWKNKAAKMSKDQLRDAIGNDLEQLEYSPSDVSKMVGKILKMIG